MYRKDLENIAYEALRDAKTDAEKYLREMELRELLTAHAQAVQYAILRRSEDALLTEAVDKVMINLPTFNGDALFTTWAHRILMGVMYDVRREERHNKEVSLEVPGFDLPGELNLNALDIVLSVRKLLNDQDYEIFEQLVLQNNGQIDAAENLGLSQAMLNRKWKRITRVLKYGLAKRLQVGRGSRVCYLQRRALTAVQ